MTGSVKSIVLERGFGFLNSPEFEKDIFFHRSELCDDLPFDELLTARRVSFETIDTRKGVQATRIRPTN